MPKSKSTPPINVPSSNVSADDLAVALTRAIEAARPTKITVSNRKRNTPWTPKDGSPKLKLKRKLYQHSVLVNENRLTNEQIAIANEIKPPKNFLTDGYLRLERRRDKGVNITYPVRTASQRLRLASEYKVNTFDDLLRVAVHMSRNPTKIEDDDE